MDTVSARIGQNNVTLLLLGETGVGKSTWINGFANFLEYDSLDVAETSDTICFIPASFTMTDENYEERVVSVGSDVNEVTAVGQSATQSPQTYTFTKGEQTIRLIDTPGIGDVRGIDQDKKNFQLILNHISHLDVLHGICILLKPNNARLNVMFSFCIKELLTNLHRDACRNIVFCFTNARSTFYRPGDTLPALKQLIAENKDVDIPLNQSTLYCMDNESIRFLYALKEGIFFTPDERKNYDTSWEKSVSEVNRLLSHVASQKPHQVQNTISLNNARQTILALTKPLVEISQNIQTNIALSEDKKNELVTSQKSSVELAKDLVLKTTEVEKTPLESPRTVCTNTCCIDVVPKGPYSEINYKRPCHTNCSSGKKKHFEIVGIVGHKTLKKCSAFSGGKCLTCGCSWEYHMKILHTTSIVEKQAVDSEKQKRLSQNESAVQQIQDFLKMLDDNLEELKSEQNEITSASAKFACFLKNNAIRPYNDSIIAYLTHFINEEKNKVGLGASSKVLDGLLEMKSSYEEEIKLLEGALQKGEEEPVSPADLENCIQSLYSLKHCGENLQKLMNTSVETQASAYNEKKIVRTKSTVGKTVATEKPQKIKKPNFFETVFGKKVNRKKIVQNPQEPVKNPRPDLFKHGVPTKTAPARLPANQKPPPRPEPTYPKPIQPVGVFPKQIKPEPIQPKPVSTPHAQVSAKPPVQSGIEHVPKKVTSGLLNMEMEKSYTGNVAQPPPPPKPPTPPPVDFSTPSLPQVDDNRASLLAHIRQGTKLKKVQTSTNKVNQQRPMDPLTNAIHNEISRRGLVMNSDSIDYDGGSFDDDEE